MMTEFQRGNLLLLATYLEALPADYDHFDMSEYVANEELDGDDDTQDEYLVALPIGTVDLNVCGTVACAVGHGPNAGVKARQADYDWDIYALRVFGTLRRSVAFRYLFGWEWVDTDNTPAGATQRIHTFLASGVPDDFV